MRPEHWRELVTTGVGAGVNAVKQVRPHPQYTRSRTHIFIVLFHADGTRTS